MNKQFLYSVSILMGTIVGIGIFGVPFTFMKSGFLTGILFLVLVTALTLITNLAFGEITLRTRGNHQIAGYTEIYLGSNWKWPVSFSFALVVYAALLAYIIIGGEFLSNIFSVTSLSLSSFSLSTLFFIILSLGVLSGLKRVSWFEFFMTGSFLGTILLVLFLGLPKIHLDIIPVFRKEFFFLPFGVLLFALRGFPAIPLQREILEGKEEFLKKSILWGTLIPPVLYLLFAFVVVGISGDTTSPEAVSGLVSGLSFNIILLLSVFGLFAIATSFLGLGIALVENFYYDFHLPKILSWFIVIFPPYVLFFLGTRDFISIINLAGAIAIGLESIIFVLLYQKIKEKGTRIPEYSLNLPKWVWYGMILLFSLGIIYTLVF